jgi:hypothetical protein
MSRTLLTYAEMVDLDRALTEAYRAHELLRERFPMARLISRPAIPAPLSESLVAHAAPAIFGPGASAAYGGTQADLVVHRNGAAPAFVEVKATGSGEFQEIKPRDLAADVLVWVAFGSRYVADVREINLYVLPRPSRFTPPADGAGNPRRKFMLQAFLSQARRLHGFSHWTLDEVVGAPIWMAGSG